MTGKSAPPLTLEERLRKLERLTHRQGVEFNVLMRAVWSLIVTHPNPAAFADQFQEATERTVAIHLNDELVTDEVRETSHRLAMELVELARAEHQQRLQKAQQG